MNKLTRISATVASSVALVAGFAGVVGASPSISNTGDNSSNKISDTHDTRTTVDNTNKLKLTNNNPQTANTGDAEAERNTTAGDVTSGNASNDSSLDATVTVDNSGASALVGGSGGGMGSWTNDASIDTTGPDSVNTITSKNSTHTTVTNDNNVTVTNNNTQKATSGDASAEHNTTAGDVTSGDAMNTSTTTLDVSVTN